MTAVVLPFVPIETKTARENMVAFIEHAKATGRYFVGPDAVQWDSNTWDFRPFAATRGQNVAGHVLNFTTYETTVRGPRSKSAVDMAAPFLDQAKALEVHLLTTTSTSSGSQFMSALRMVEKAFRDLGLTPDICDLTPRVLDAAADMARVDQASPWTIGQNIERLALEFVNPGRLCSVHLLWSSPFPWVAPKRNDTVNKEGGALENSDKLPHLKSVLDLAGVFTSSDAPHDVVVTAWFALAMFAPNRVNEILTLPVDCATEMDGVFGLSWRPLKGGTPMTKFATTGEWAEVARTAIRRLQAIGAPARVAAKWYEENPGRLYLPPGWEHLRDVPMTIHEMGHVIGRREKITGGAMRSNLDLTERWTSDPVRTGSPGRQGLYTFDSVERTVIGQLPADFPYADRKFGLLASQALFCVPMHILRAYADPMTFVPDLISASQIGHELGKKPTGQTIFARHNLHDPRTGKPWKLDTHGPRHLLNTLAQSKHLSETLIAFWSGRKRIDQNAWYDHVPQEAFIDAFVRMGESAPRELRVVGPLEDKVVERARRETISRDDALRLELGSIINTRYGLCRHNYALTPCPKNKNCIGCGENTFTKGDPKHLAEARQQHGISARAVTNCRRAIELGEPGVDRWLQKHVEAEERWGLAIERLTDASLEDGTLITLPPPRSSQTKAGLSAAVRALHIGPDVEETPADDGFSPFEDI